MPNDNDNKHTPGPWVFELTSNDVEGNTYTRVKSNENEIAANIALISSAPDLLAALELAYGELINKTDDHELCNVIKQAINKAKGGSQ